MITSVATWRCKCGVSVKVVTEADKARKAEQERVVVACPKCGEEHVIYGHRVLKVTAHLDSHPPDSHNPA